MEHNRIIYERPYDSEVEYLENSGNDNPTIITNIKPSTNYTYKWKYKILNLTNYNYVFSTDTSITIGNWFLFGGVETNNKTQLHIKDKSNTQGVPLQTNVLYEGILRKNGNNIEEYFNNVLYVSLHYQNFTASNYLRYLRKPGISIQLFYLQILDANNNTILDLIPVRKGSIGYLYDKVSKKLFGNQGTGNFILGQDIANPVPNIRRVFRFGNKRFVMPCGLEEGVDYQKYDWLKGDGAAVINTNLYITDYRYVTLSITVRDFIVLSVVSYVLAAGAVTGSGYGFNFSVARPNTNPYYRITDGYSTVKNLCPLNGTHTIEIKDGGIYADNIFKTSDYEYNPLSSRVLGLFGNVYGSTQKGNGYISNFNIQSSVGNLNFAPCQLLRGIPASLDANGIVRTAGECGMIDSISGKFYGNVAASGSFTVSND